jgi:peptidyl-tRNA hydrolase, PTH2 family
LEKPIRPVKQVLVMREDLGMSPGKLAAQASHAALKAYEIADKDCVDTWHRSGMTKVVLAVYSERDLVTIYKQATAEYLPTVIIADEGRTEIAPGSLTGVGIGPAPIDAINLVTGNLNLYGKKEESENY